MVAKYHHELCLHYAFDEQLFLHIFCQCCTYMFLFVCMSASSIFAQIVHHTSTFFGFNHFIRAAVLSTLSLCSSPRELMFLCHRKCFIPVDNNCRHSFKFSYVQLIKSYKLITSNATFYVRLMCGIESSYI